jgi:hypothetical protein
MLCPSCSAALVKKSTAASCDILRSLAAALFGLRALMDLGSSGGSAVQTLCWTLPVPTCNPWPLLASMDVINLLNLVIVGCQKQTITTKCSAGNGLPLCLTRILGSREVHALSVEAVPEEPKRTASSSA